MATTGFWPLKGSLKKVIDYADNPEKTSLSNVLEYTSNKDKTNQQLFISGINCTAENAYEMMMETKRQFGKLGGNVAYHGFQSFQAGEVSPEEAHQIGIETAKRMWGDEYEIVVTTHLNTDNIHNHIVTNSVSFRTGRKFENHVSDHYRLREISDEICREHQKSVLENSSFYKNNNSYWLHKKGIFTYRDILKADIDTAISVSTSFKSFELNMRKLGYRFNRNMYYEHPSVIIPGRSKPIRIDSFGEEYTKEAIYQRIIQNRYERPKRITVYFPLLKIRRKRETWGDTIVNLFNTLLDILELALLPKETKMVPISPELRYELQLLDNRIQQYKFLTDNEIHSSQELFSTIDEIQKQINELEMQRNKVSNKIRRAKTDDEKDQLKLQRKELSSELKILCENFKTATDIKDSLPKIRQMIETEYKLEKEEFNKVRSKNYER